MSAPLSAAGYMDDAALSLNGYGPLVDLLLENVPELLHPYSVRTFARMRHDPQIAAVLKAYRLAIGRAHWYVDGAGCRDEVTARIADELGLPIKGYLDAADPNDPEAKVMAPTGARRRRFTWAEHLRVAASLKLTFGHAPFAQQWTEEGGQFRLDLVQERMPQTIAGIYLNADGTLKSAVQNAFAGRKDGPRMSTANHELVWYTHEREGSNYFGQSLIRESYGPWLIKDQMLRVHATSIRRFGMGVPQVNAPAGATPQQEAQAQRLASSYKAGEFSGAGLPYGFTFDLKGMTGSVPDAVAFVNYLDRQMTRSTLTSILDMAVAEKGNRSLGETVMDLMVYAQQAEAEALAEDATTQIVVPLVDANWSEDEPAPCICVGDVGADVEMTMQDLNWAMEYGGLQPDQPARAWVRQRYGIPPEDPNYKPPTDPAATNPTAGGAA